MANRVLSRLALTLGCAICAVCALVGPAVAQDEFGVTIGADLVSDYIWRGQVRNDDGAIQPWACLKVDSFTAKVWGSLDLDDQPNDAQWEFTEVRFLGSYAIPIGSYTLDVGAIYYNYPNTESGNTFEVFGTFTFTGVIFDPYVSLYYDLDEVEGFYARVGGGYGQELETFNWALDVSLGLGSSDYNDAYFGLNELGLNDLRITFTVTVPFSEQFSASAFVLASWLIDDDFRESVEDDSEIGFGGGISYSF